MTAATNNQAVREGLIELYTKYFGSITAKSYAKFYADKDMPTVLASAEELLIEYAGETKGKEIISFIYKKYSIQKN